MGKVINVKFHFLQLFDFLIHHHKWAFWVQPYCLWLTRSNPSSSSMPCCDPHAMLEPLLDMMFASQTHLNAPPTKLDWPHVLQPEQSVWCDLHHAILHRRHCSQPSLLLCLLWQEHFPTRECPRTSKSIHVGEPPLKIWFRIHSQVNGHLREIGHLSNPDRVIQWPLLFYG